MIKKIGGPHHFLSFYFFSSFFINFPFYNMSRHLIIKGNPANNSFRLFMYNSSYNYCIDAFETILFKNWQDHSQESLHVCTSHFPILKRIFPVLKRIWKVMFNSILALNPIPNRFWRFFSKLWQPNISDNILNINIILSASLEMCGRRKTPLQILVYACHDWSA